MSSNERLKKKEAVNFYIEAKTKETLMKHCKKRGITMTHAFRLAIDMFLDSVKVKRKKAVKVKKEKKDVQ